MKETVGSFTASRETLNRDLLTVQDELAHAGLWHARSRLLQVETFWCALPQWPPLAWGFFIHRCSQVSRWLGYQPGHIYIPAIVWNRRDLINVLRHEYAHAVAHYYPKLIQRSREFTRVFGGRYQRGTPNPGSTVDPSSYLSRYAATEPCEDFAETWMFYLRRKGKLPARANLKIRRKWEFVRSVIEAIRLHQPS